MTSTRRSAASLRGDAGLIYEILTDYDNYAEWLPGVAQAKSLAREGDLAIAEFELTGPRKDRLVFECIHTRNKMVLWRTIEGTAPVTQVEWSIESAGAGQLQVRLSVESRLHWSRFLGSYRRFMDPALCLKALQGQLASFMPEIALADESGEKLLELTETEEGVVCWIRGKKYVLKEESPQGAKSRS